MTGAGWDSPLGLLREETWQRRDEGCAIPDDLVAAMNALDPVGDAWNGAVVDPLYERLNGLSAADDLAAREPNDLDAIRALRPDGPRQLGWEPSDEVLVDRLHGALTGRAVGCALGKPVEALGSSGGRQDPGLGRRGIRAYLEVRGAWPLADFFPGDPSPDGVVLECPSSQRERIEFMEADDDIHYTLAALGVLETAGPDFQWRDVAWWWLAHIPTAYVCTAELQALLNLQARSVRGRAGPATAAWTRRHRNPYREWIGAQIRADGWGWACAGNPELGAELAWRDAHWTHERNGIYGEMMFAAMAAAAFVESDPRRLVEIGLSEVPAHSRLALAVRRALEWTQAGLSWEECVERVEVEGRGLSPVHTINNAQVCVIATVLGGLDPLASTCIAVAAGLDTDCNGATVGALAGAARGMRGWESDLAPRLHDTLRPAIAEFHDSRMADLAPRWAAAWRTLRAGDAVTQGS